MSSALRKIYSNTRVFTYKFIHKDASQAWKGADCTTTEGNRTKIPCLFPLHLICGVVCAERQVVQAMLIQN